MSEKFQNKYRIPSTRLQNWDYGSNAMYFVTICTAHRACYFGDIVNGEMVLSETGKIAEQYWREIPIHFPFVILGEFVIMPNHVHGIIIINKPLNVIDDVIVETQNFASLPTPTPTPESISDIHNKFGPQSQNLASIVRGFKIGVTKFAQNNHIDFAWQSRFHDHIIRNNESFKKISTYIINNPLNWTGR